LSLQIDAITPSVLERLLEIGAMLNSTLDLRQLLELVIRTATELTRTEAASILLLEGNTGELYFAAASGSSPPRLGHPVPAEESIAGWIVRHGQPVILNDVRQDERYYAAVENATQFPCRDMMGVPLVTKGEAMGALEVINKKDGLPYSDEDLTLLMILASQAAIAISNARLFQQSDVIAEFMHELKTPLMALTAATEILARESATAGQRELLDMIQHESARLAKMAQDFLDLARLESGRAPIRRELLSLSELVREVIRAQSPAAAERQVALASEVAPDLPTVLGDHERLKQALLNLVHNAIKYNVPGGRVLVRASAWPDALVVEVADTGRGIAAEYLPHLFERFYRVPDAEGFLEGTGLGLSIVKRIIEEHHGRVEIRSTLGEGTTVTCYLPLPASGL
jgi:signal transduction histidine kinase